MSLRTKLLGLFALLAVLPLVGMGLFNYLQSLRALESLVAGQAAMFADRAATELADRYSIVDANVSLPRRASGSKGADNSNWTEQHNVL
jgi:hypothetical protein